MRILVALITILTSVFANSMAYAAEKLVIAQPFDALIWSPIYIARKNGYFSDEGLDVEVALVNGSPASITAVLTNNAQLGLGDPAATMRAREAGQKVKAVALVANQLVLSLIVRTSTLQERGISATSPLDDKLKALSGLTMAVNAVGTPADHTLRYILGQAGLKPESDVTITTMESHAAGVAAFKQGRIDGFVAGPPANQMILAEGGATSLIDFSKGEYPPLANTAFVTLTAEEGWLKANPETAKKALRAVAKALTLIHEKPNEAREVVRPFFPKLEASVFDASWENVIAAYTTSAWITAESLTSNIKLSESATGKPLTIDVNDAFTNDYVE